MAEAIRLVRQENHSAESSEDFSSFFQGEHARLFRALVIVTKNLADAEDVTQEAFVRVWERWDRVREMEDPVGYLYRIALNLVFQKRRRAATAARRLARGFARGDSYDDPLDRVEATDTVARLLLGLPPRQRAAVVLTQMLGYDSTAAAAILKIRPGTVRMLVSQARALLNSQSREGK
ncbi:MAG: RNA polymerase sigma factor [Actinomycetota bacterium]